MAQTTLSRRLGQFSSPHPLFSVIVVVVAAVVRVIIISTIKINKNIPSAARAPVVVVVASVVVPVPDPYT